MLKSNEWKIDKRGLFFVVGPISIEIPLGSFRVCHDLEDDSYYISGDEQYMHDPSIVVRLTHRQASLIRASYGLSYYEV